MARNRSLKRTGTTAMIVDLGHLFRGKLIVLIYSVIGSGVIFDADPEEVPAFLCLSGSGPRCIILTDFFYKSLFS